MGSLLIDCPRNSLKVPSFVALTGATIDKTRIKQPKCMTLARDCVLKKLVFPGIVVILNK